MTKLVIVGDEAYTAEEWDALLKRRERDRLRYRTDPERRAKVRAAAHKWNRLHPERVKEIHRESQARRRADREYRARERERQREQKRAHYAARRVIVSYASLHDLGCTGPTRATGCRCSKKVIAERVESAA